MRKGKNKLMKKSKLLILLIIHLSFTCSKNEAKTNEKFVVEAKSGLSLRKLPSQTSEKITVIPYNQPIYLIEKTTISDVIENKKGYWWKVEWYSNEGFVFSTFLRKISFSDTISTVQQISLISDAILYIENSDEISVWWIESPFPISKNQIMTVYPLYRPFRRTLQIKVIENEFEKLSDGGDAFLEKGFKVLPDGSYERYNIKHSNIVEKDFHSIKNPDRNPDYPSDVIVIYPPVEKVKCIEKKNLKEELPKGEPLNTLSYALDLDDDNKEDLTLFKDKSGQFTKGYVKKNNKWVLMYSFSGKVDDPIYEYQCD